MFYAWLYPLKKYFIGFNLFQYITFRAAMAGVTAFLISLWIGPPVIRFLAQLNLKALHLSPEETVLVVSSIGSFFQLSDLGLEILEMLFLAFAEGSLRSAVLGLAFLRVGGLNRTSMISQKVRPICLTATATFRAETHPTPTKCCGLFWDGS